MALVGTRTLQLRRTPDGGDCNETDAEGYRGLSQQECLYSNGAVYDDEQTSEVRVVFDCILDYRLH